MESVFEETETESQPGVVIEPPPEPVGKKKRVMTDEQRAQMKANLAKGRATALANRKKKAILRRKAKQDEQKRLDEAVIAAVTSKRPEESETELMRLKKELEELKMQRSASLNPPKPEPEPEPSKPKPVVEKQLKPVEPVAPAPEPMIVLSTYEAAPW